MSQENVEIAQRGWEHFLATGEPAWDTLLTGTWGGLRPMLKDEAGLQLNATYIGEVLGNPTGGLKQGAVYEDRINFAVDADLDVMRPNQTLAGLTARLLHGIDGWLETAQPDMALVQGDTTTVLAASLACFYRRIPIGHVEAGLRTGNIWSPFPEEANRKLATPLVALHFAPTEGARDALLREAVPEEIISVTGNTNFVIDLDQPRPPAITQEFFELLKAGKVFILVYGRITYRDIFDDVWDVGYAMKYESIKDASGNMVFRDAVPEAPGFTYLKKH